MNLTEKCERSSREDQHDSSFPIRIMLNIHDTIGRTRARKGKSRTAGYTATRRKTESTYVLPLRTYIIDVSFKGSQTIEKVVLLLFEGFEFIAIEFVFLQRRKQRLIERRSLDESRVLQVLQPTLVIARADHSACPVARAIQTDCSTAQRSHRPRAIPTQRQRCAFVPHIEASVRHHRSTDEKKQQRRITLSAYLSFGGLEKSIDWIDEREANVALPFGFDVRRRARAVDCRVPTPVRQPHHSRTFRGILESLRVRLPIVPT